VLFIDLRNLKYVTINFLFDAKYIIYRRNDGAKENLKVKDYYQVAEGEHYEIRSRVYQSWPTILHNSGHSSAI